MKHGSTESAVAKRSQLLRDLHLGFGVLARLVWDRLSEPEDTLRSLAEQYSFPYPSDEALRALDRLAEFYYPADWRTNSPRIEGTDTHRSVSKVEDVAVRYGHTLGPND